MTHIKHSQTIHERSMERPFCDSRTTLFTSGLLWHNGAQHSMCLRGLVKSRRIVFEKSRWGGLFVTYVSLTWPWPLTFWPQSWPLSVEIRQKLRLMSLSNVCVCVRRKLPLDRLRCQHDVESGGELTTPLMTGCIFIRILELCKLTINCGTVFVNNYL